MRWVRLPTIRSKHLETVIHTFLSAVHALTQGYDLIHYHALGPALFSFLPRLAGKTAVTVQGRSGRSGGDWRPLCCSGESKLRHGFPTERW